LKSQYFFWFLLSICFIALGALINHRLIDKVIHNDRIRILLRFIKFSVVVILSYLFYFSNNSVVKILAAMSASFVMGTYSEPKRK